MRSCLRVCSNFFCKTAASGSNCTESWIFQLYIPLITENKNKENQTLHSTEGNNIFVVVLGV